MRGCCEASPSALAVQIIASKQRCPCLLLAHSQFVFQPRRWKEGACLFFTLEGTRKEPVCLSPQKMQGRSQCVFHPEDTRKEPVCLSPRRCNKEPVCLSPRKMQLEASLFFTPEDIRKEPVCLSPWKIQGRSQFVFHPGRCKEGASVFNPGRYKEGASLSFTPEDTRRSQCVFHPRRCKEGASVFHPGRYKEGANLSFTPGCRGWRWPAIEDGWVGQQWEHSTCLGVIGV